MRFRTTILQSGKTATGIQIPDEIVEALGAGKRPPCGSPSTATPIAARSPSWAAPTWSASTPTTAPAAGVAGGDEVDVDIELDTAPRVVDVPADFAAALDAEPAARRTFDGLSYSNKSWHVLPIEGAKTDETRQRRIAKSVEALKEGRPR